MRTVQEIVRELCDELKYVPDAQAKEILSLTQGWAEDMTLDPPQEENATALANMDWGELQGEQVRRIFGLCKELAFAKAAHLKEGFEQARQAREL
jgi:hypothetical protein